MTLDGDLGSYIVLRLFYILGLTDLLELHYGIARYTRYACLV